MYDDSRSAAGRNMLIGGIICLIGAAVTGFSYWDASEGGRYFVAWGAILFGGLQFLRGLFQLIGLL